MSVSGVNMIKAALIQNALNISGQGSGSGTSETFGSLLSNALMNTQNAYGGKGSYTETYDLYSELLSQPSGSSGALLAALIGAGGSGASPFMMLSLCGALTDSPPAVSPQKTGTGDVTQPPWIMAHPAVTSNVFNRSPGLYTSIINQFNVETNPRYSPKQGGTYCNIFVWDITSAMGAEIPHYYNAKTGAPMKRGDEGASQMTANRMYNWLHEHGGDYGWYEVTPEQAQNLANQGHPVVTALYRNGAHGHVQMVCPSRNGIYDEKKGVTVAQAGRHLRSYTYITNIYNASLPKVSYFAHI